MEKFLSIPVTSEQSQLVSATGIILVEQASTTTVTVAYKDGSVVTLTHATAGAGSEAQRDAIQNAIVAALQTPWYEVAYKVSGLPFAVSGIAVA
jgi:hypothetical protein